MNRITTQIRHFLSGLAGLGTYLVSLGMLNEGSAAQVNDAGGALIDPLAGLLAAIAIAVSRELMIQLGKRFPIFSKFSDGEDNDGVSRPSGGSGGIVPLGLILFIGVLFLPSCSGEYPLTGSITFRDPNTGAKGGLVFEPGSSPRASVRVPVYDEEGNLIGVGELSGPLSKEIEAAK